MKIYKAIKDDHDIQRDLIEKIKKTSGDSEERNKLWEELKKELEVHAVAEERHFYKPLIDTDEMQEDARHGIAEHHEIDELIEELDETDMSSPHWLATLDKLAEKVLHHLEDEEEDFFGKSKKLYDDDKEKSLADDYEDTMKEYREGWPDNLPGNEEE